MCDTAAALRRIRYSTTPYARGFRVGVGAVLDSDQPPPGVNCPERAEYLEGIRDGRKSRARSTGVTT